MAGSARVKFAGVLAVLIVCVGGANARAQSEPPAAEPDPRAEELNERGKTLYSEKHDYPRAAEMFRKAIAVSPDARYYYNLCAALEQLEQWREALDACDAVFRHNPRGELAQKTGLKAADIRERRRLAREAQPPPANPPNPDSPPSTQPTPTGPAPIPTQPTPNVGGEETVLAMGAEAPNYLWGLGADLGFVFNGSVGQREYAENGLALRINGAMLLSERTRLGIEAYLHLAAFGESELFMQALSIVDFGGAVYWHKHLTRGLHFTPLAGLSLSALSVDTRDGLFSYGAFGLRFEAALEWRLPGGRHVLRAAPIALHVYPGTSLQIAGEREPSSFFGLDRTGVTWTFTVGYSYRFETPLFRRWQLE